MSDALHIIDGAAEVADNRDLVTLGALLNIRQSVADGVMHLQSAIQRIRVLADETKDQAVRASLHEAAEALTWVPAGPTDLDLALQRVRENLAGGAA